MTAWTKGEILRGVEKQQIDVRLRIQLAPPVAALRDQRETRFGAGN